MPPRIVERSTYNDCLTIKWTGVLCFFARTLSFFIFVDLQKEIDSELSDLGHLAMVCWPMGRGGNSCASPYCGKELQYDYLFKQTGSRSVLFCRYGYLFFIFVSIQLQKNQFSI